MCKIRIFLLFFFLLLHLGSIESRFSKTRRSDAEAGTPRLDIRLPKSISPRHYQLIIIPLTDANIFQGIVTINATVLETTDRVTLNVKSGIRVVNANVKVNDEIVKRADLVTDSQTEKTTIILDRYNLTKNTDIAIVVNYNGGLRGDSLGLFRSSYFDSDGNVKRLVATQFQASYARHAFPCFDEPGFKANFTVRVYVQGKQSCISNMPLAEKTHPNNSSSVAWYDFRESVPMSTYLVAFVVSDFVSRSNEEGTFRVWSRPSAIQQTEYALELAPRALSHFSSLLRQDYPLEKMDLVGLPDLESEGMENWGLISFAENFLLYDRVHSTDRDLLGVAMIVVHEICHQWFGNAVTPDWWDSLWLSEGFARYFQYMATAKLHPTWKLEGQFITDSQDVALQSDAMPTSASMNRQVSDFEDLEDVFDEITYGKAAAVVHMMESFLGNDVFVASLRTYLDNRKYKTVTPEALWTVIQRKVDESGGNTVLPASVEEIMSTWSDKPGYPVVTVVVDKKTVKLTQGRFLLKGNASGEAVWWVPLTWTTGNSRNFQATSEIQHWLAAKSEEISVNLEADEWIVFNIQRRGFYRVNYDRKTWYKLIRVLNSDSFETIHELNRVGIVDDLLNLARSGLIPYEIALDGLEYLSRETNYLPIKAALNAVDYLNRRFNGNEDNDLLKDFIVSLLKDVSNQLGYDDKPETDDIFQSLLRQDVNLWLCNLGDPACIRQSLKYFQEWKTDPSKFIPKHQRETAYCTAVRHGTTEDWEFLWQRYQKTNVAHEQRRILIALGCTNDTKTLEKFLANAVSGYEKSRIQKQDILYIFKSVCSNSLEGAKYVLKFVVDYHSKILQLYGNDDPIAEIVSMAASEFSTRELVDVLQQFAASTSKEFQGIASSLQDALEDANFELKWFERYGPEIVAWLRRRIPTTGSTPTETTPTNATTLPDPGSTVVSETTSDSTAISTDSTITSTTPTPTDSTSTITDTTTTTTGPTIVPEPGSTTISETTSDSTAISTESTITSTAPTPTDSTSTTTDTTTTTTGPTIVPDPGSTTISETTSDSTAISTDPTITSTASTSTITDTTIGSATPTDPTIIIPDPDSTTVPDSTAISTESTTPSIASTPTLTTTDTTIGSTISTPSPEPETTTSSDPPSNLTATSPGSPTTTSPESTTLPSSTLPSVVEDPEYLLPTDVIPTRYFISLAPDIEEEKFVGSVKIECTVSRITKTIVLHSDGIFVKSVKVVTGRGRIKVTETSYNETNHFLTLHLEDYLVSNSFLNVTMEYTGIFSRDGLGIFRSSYANPEGVTRNLVTTYLAPIGARRVFPCFDEPAYKARFTVKVLRNPEYRVLGNMPLSYSETESTGGVWDTFEETPKMSTYLVAVVISDFEESRDGSGPNERLDVWARPDARIQSNFALSMAEKLLPVYENILGLSYRLPKLSMAAIPGYPVRGMENWGLVTYRERDLLSDPDHSGTEVQQNSYTLVSHELCHQWFGNLVTPRWWKYAWLSEGICRYFQYFATSRLEPLWKLESQFVVKEMHPVFELDASDSTHPVSRDVATPDEVKRVFDTIAYSKAASVLRMLRMVLGSQVFHRSLNGYLLENSYDVVIPDQLYKVFQEETDKAGMKLNDSVKSFMDPWTTQPGFPVLRVTIANNGTVKFVQRRFVLDSNSIKDEEIWRIPISWARKSHPNFYDTKPKIWLKDRAMSLDLEFEDNEWIIFNVQRSGYYRVLYDQDTWRKLVNLLKSDEYVLLHEVNRAALVDDLLAFGRTGDVEYDVVLEATQYLVKERDYVPWVAASSGLMFLYDRFAGQEVLPLFEIHVSTILRPVYDRLGFMESSSDSHSDKILRSLVIDWGCKLRFVDCIDHSVKLFDRWKINRNESIPPNLRRTVYCTAIKNGDSSHAEFLWKEYFSTNIESEKQLILFALGCSTDAKILEKYLMKIISKEFPVQPQDPETVFSSICSSSLFGVEFVIDFVTKYYDEIVDFYGNADKVTNILHRVALRLSTKALLDKFETAITTSTNLSALSLQPQLKVATDNFNWYNEKLPKIVEWLEKTYPIENYRLPKTIIPEKYDIYLSPEFEGFTFEGRTEIQMEVKTNTSKLVLNMDRLDISDVSIFERTRETNEDTRVGILSMEHNANTQILTVYLEKVLNEGTFLIARFSFSGILSDDMKGLYRSFYLDAEENKQWIAVSNFGMTFARRAFPCFDEPSFKARFEIRLERPSNCISLSNMPKVQQIQLENSDREVDVYQESTKMSTYVVAILIGNYWKIGNESINFNIWSPSDQVEYGKFALRYAPQLFEQLKYRFSVEYPVAKMDFLAVPNFNDGAMGNWGLVAFREYGLMYSENVTSAFYQRYIVTIIAHELTHMWFGNLVTCEWWDYAWLHEGFAQYFQWVVSDALEENWELMSQFVLYELHVAMSYDSSSMYVPPMNRRVSTPAEIANIFDPVTFAKSASILRMLDLSFGDHVFSIGLRDYLFEYQYRTAKPSDLWRIMEPLTSINIGVLPPTARLEAIMDSWTNEPGVPVVQVFLEKGNKIRLSQQRFLAPRKHKTAIPSSYWIPITYTTESESIFTPFYPHIWLHEEEKSISVELEGKEDWIILNVQQVGYYRVNYDEKLWGRLIRVLSGNDYRTIHPVNRAQIIDDILNLALGDYVEYDLALNATKYMVQETHHLPWKALFNNFERLYGRFSGYPVQELFVKYVRYLVEDVYHHLGFEGVDGQHDGQMEQLNRELILTWACKVELEHCVNKSMVLFYQSREKEMENRIPTNSRYAVYCTAVRHGTVHVWKFLWQKYVDSKFASERVTILKALGCSRNEDLLEWYLNSTLNPDGPIRFQDLESVYFTIYSGEKSGFRAAMNFLFQHFQDIYRYYGDWNGVVSLFCGLAAYATTEDEIMRLELFVYEHSQKFRAISGHLKGAISNARDSKVWYDDHQLTIYNWLNKTLAELEKPINDNQLSPGSGNEGQGFNYILLLSIVCLLLIVLLLISTIILIYFRKKMNRLKTV